MANFFSHLFSSGNGRKSDHSGKRDCQAKDPNNCRICHTGKYSEAAKKAELAEKEDDLTPTEKELARIKAAHTSVGKSVTGINIDWDKYLHTSHKPHPKPSYSQVSHFGGIWDKSEYRPAKPEARTAAEIEKAIKEANPENLEDVKALGTYVDSKGVKHDTRVSPLTDKPISKECDTVLNALMCGVRVKDHEIESLPEWKEAQKAYAEFSKKLTKDGLPSNTWSIRTKERNDLQDAIYAKMSAPVVTHETNGALKEGESYEVKKGFRFDIVTGLPAGGKSVVFADRLSVENRARLADSDTIKKLLPEYENGLGANIVHDESTFLNKDLLEDTFDKMDPKFGDNIVYPTLGGSSPKLIDFIEMAHKAGYKVHLHLNEISAEKAKGRMLYRMINTGRYLPLSVFSMTHDAVRAYKESRKYADVAEWYRSDAGKGREPVKVESVENAAPARRKDEYAKNYGDYGLFGYKGGKSPSVNPKPVTEKKEAYEFADEDVPDWLDDPAFWDDPVNWGGDNYKAKEKEPPAEEPKRSGMSIEDILAGKGKL